MEVIIGTAGHIDHGKTALIKALTGTDADRLPEEKRRGITVDLGFAEMTIGDIHLGFIDVPGHERFVKNMLAGASGIDIVMLVVAADEGVMPQTLEHFEICRLLGSKAGLVVITKTDLVDEETLDLAKLDVAEMVENSFLEHSPVVGVSSATGLGIDLLKDVLCTLAGSLVTPENYLTTRLPIDRSFSMKGFGTVVTGTLGSGELVEGAELELLPVKTPVRVRGIQTHGRAAARAGGRQRVAVNLAGIDHSAVCRGMVLSETGTLRPTQIIDARIEVLPGAPHVLRSRQRIRVHIGTIEALARVHVLNALNEVAAGASDLIQIRLEVPVVAVPGDRFIIRSYSPQATIGGGTVLNNDAAKHRRRDLAAVRQSLSKRLEGLGDIAVMVGQLITEASEAGMDLGTLGARTGIRAAELIKTLERMVATGELINAGGLYIPGETFGAMAARLLAAVRRFHTADPLARGISREALRDAACRHLPVEMFHAVLEAERSAGTVTFDKELVRHVSHQTQLSPAAAAFIDAMRSRYRAYGLEVPKVDDELADAVAGGSYSKAEARKFLQVLLDSGDIVRVSDDLCFSRQAIDDLAHTLRIFASETTDRLIDVAKFKELAGISRKYAIPLLEYFDRERITRRAGDKRIIL